MRRYRHDPLRVPDEAVAVATLDGSGVLLGGDGNPLHIPYLAPDNSEEALTVDLVTLELAAGAIVTIEDTQGATANPITVTPVGALVDASGAAVDQLVIDTDDGYATLLITSTTTVILASKGVDLDT